MMDYSKYPNELSGVRLEVVPMRSVLCPQWWQLRRRFRWWKLERDVRSHRENLSPATQWMLTEAERALEAEILYGEVSAVDESV